MVAPLAVLRRAGAAPVLHGLVEDSIDEMLTHTGLHEALMDVLEQLAASPALAPLLLDRSDYPVWLLPDGAEGDEAGPSAPAPSRALSSAFVLCMYYFRSFALPCRGAAERDRAARSKPRACAAAARRGPQLGVAAAEPRWPHFRSGARRSRHARHASNVNDARRRERRALRGTHDGCVRDVSRQRLRMPV
jgi:hypothetical protein